MVPVAGNTSPAEEYGVRIPSATRPSTRPGRLGLLVGLAGLVVAGAVGALIGFVGGALAAWRPRIVLLAACVALLATMAFTLFEQPLAVSGIPGFPLSHPLAELAAKAATVFLLAGLAGMAAHSVRIDRSQTNRRCGNSRDPGRVA
jgi:hypothetical protein